MKLPSLLAFQPRFYRGGPIRHHLAALFDLVATLRPRRLVIVGFGEGEAFFTLCQAVKENHVECECFALRRGTSPEDDTSWQEGTRYAAETYPEFAHLLTEDSSAAVRRFADQKVDFLLLDREFPRAIQFCLLAAQDALHAISGTPLGTFRNTPERLLGQLCSDLSYASVDEIINQGLHEYLDELQTKMNQIGAGIHETFFALKTPKAAKRTAQSQGQTQSQH